MLGVVVSVYECMVEVEVGLYEHRHNDQRHHQHQQETVTPA
jgi:hypothetical protein